MLHYKYLIVGGGMTADAAVRGIRAVDSEGSIGIIGAESEPPYDRPPLTKGLWKGKPLAKIFRGTEKLDVSLHLGRHARSLDPQAKRVVDDRGDEYTYEKLLLATGGTPRRLPFDAPDSLIYYRTAADYRRLRDLVAEPRHVVVIGAGFIGSEIAASLASSGNRVTMVFPEGAIGERIFPADLAQYVTRYYREQGVEVEPGQAVTGFAERSSQTVVATRSLAGQLAGEVAGDVVIAGLGIQPNVELAQRAGLQVEDGIVVDASLRASRPDIYAAGDVASFYNPALDRRLRVEHEDNANTMGKMAGEAMAGRPVRYDHLPFFYSDLFDLGYEAVGELDSRLETVEDWQEPFRKGVVYYLRDGRVRGVLLWNVWEQVAAARKLIAEPGPFTPAGLKNRLPA